MNLHKLWKSWNKKVKESQKRGLKANVVSMYTSRLGRSGVYRPKIVKDLILSGKLKEHIVDIYFEFVRMNNLERTIVKTIEGREVTESDLWEFACVLKDLQFYAKGIVYYDGRVADGAGRIAEVAQIELIKFDFVKEISKDAGSILKTMLPDKDIIGDPFWTIMETTPDLDENTGVYKNMVFFLSKKQAEKYCFKETNEKVFGISQQHLKVLIGLQEKRMCPEVLIAYPEFVQKNHGEVCSRSISHEKLKKYYVREAE